MPMFTKLYIKTFSVGLSLGFFIAYVMFFSQSFLYEVEYQTSPILDPGIHSEDEEIHMIDATLANKLYDEVRVLCWVMTVPNNHETRAKHVKATWGKRCNNLLFMSSIADSSLPTIALPVNEGRNNLWLKTTEAFKYVYNNYYDRADWFLKADDDTYVIVENLRYMLMPHEPNDPIYFGCRFKPYVKQGYMSGGAGYVLSKEALRRFVEEGIKNTSDCSKPYQGEEDVQMERCMKAVDVKTFDSRDSLGRRKFFPFPPEYHLIPGRLFEIVSFREYLYYENSEGMDCCSDSAVSFHFVKPYQMYVLEYLVYHLRPYGISFHVEMPSVLETSSKKNESQDLDIFK